MHGRPQVGGEHALRVVHELDGELAGLGRVDDVLPGGFGRTERRGELAKAVLDLGQEAAGQRFHLPVVYFVDNPGVMIGLDAERAGTLRAGCRALSAVHEAQTPWASILVRRCFGVGGATHRNEHRHSLRLAWPSGTWGSLPLEGGIEAAYKRVIEAAEDPDAARAELMAKLQAVRSPFRTAETFRVEDIIDPAETRPILCRWVRTAYHRLAAGGPRPSGRTYRP